MRIYTKHIKILALTPEEVRTLHDMIAEAETGKTVHYAERKQMDGSFFGVSVSEENRTPDPMPPRSMSDRRPAR